MSVKFMFDPTYKKPVRKKPSLEPHTMSQVFGQRFVYASIIQTKNYSNFIAGKDHGLNTFDGDIDDLEDEKAVARKLAVDFDDFLPTISEQKRTTGPTKEGHLILFDGKEKRKNKSSKYFYNDIESGVSESVRLDYAYKKNGNVFHTTKDKHIKGQYGDPFASVTIRLFERRILTDGNKVTIKVYKQVKERGINMKYFMVSYIIQSLTLNFATGNFTVTNISKKGKARTQTFKRNSSYALKEFLSLKNGIFMSSDFIKANFPPQIQEEFLAEFNNDEFNEAVANALKIEVGDYSSSDVFITKFIEQFVQLKSIKVPNDYLNLILRYYPTEKYLKKNKRKLVMSVLDMFGIKSDITNKIMHTNPKLNILALVRLCYLFGGDYPKYIGSLNGECFRPDERKLNNGAEGSPQSAKNITLQFKESISKFDISNTEKENVIRILNSRHRKIEYNRGEVNETTILQPVILTNDFITTLFDHFDMIRQIRPYDPDLRLKARNIEDYDLEHTELSKLMTCIRKGSVVRYTFDPAMLKEIEQPIPASKYNPETETFERRVFRPVLFKMEEDFIEEGKFMHHCVAGYSNREDTIIISLRLDDDDERVTSQYNTKTGANIQSKFICNAPPPEHFIQPLETLNAKVRTFAYQDKLKYIEKVNVPLVINGKEVVIERRNVWGNVMDNVAMVADDVFGF